jgi:hypothetical protein
MSMCVRSRKNLDDNDYGYVVCCHDCENCAYCAYCAYYENCENSPDISKEYVKKETNHLNDAFVYFTQFVDAITKFKNK